MCGGGQKGVATKDELGRDDFFAKMAGASADAVQLVRLIQTHFEAQDDVTVYFRRVPDLRLAARWLNPKGKWQQQVFVTVQWQPRKQAFRIGAYIYPNYWHLQGFSDARLFTADPLISYISIPEADWRTNQAGLLAVLEQAKVKMLGERAAPS